MKTQIYLFVFAICFSSMTFSQTLWCPKSGISGFEEEAHKAKAILTDNTSDLQKMEVFVTVKGNNLYIQSNYAPDGMNYPLKIATNEEMYEMKDWLKYLIDPENVDVYNSEFTRAYRDDIVINVDAAVFSHPSYKKLVWNDAKNVRIVEEEQVFETEILPATKKRVVKIHEHTYVELDKEEVCDIASQLSKVKEIADKLYEANNKELNGETISTTSNNEEVQAAVKQSTFASFFNSVASSGLTLINFACEPAETTKDLVFDAYREGASYRMEKVGQIKIHLPDEVVASQSTAYNNTTITDNSTSSADNENSTSSSENSDPSTGLGKAWYFIIGIVVLAVIRAIAKQS